MAATEGWVTLGYVARTHGVRGTLRLHWHDAIAELPKFPKRLRLTLPNAPPQILDVTAHRLSNGGSLVDFSQITTMDDAATWRGAQVDVPEGALPTPEPGDVYLYRLMGGRCIDDATDALLGTLSQIYSHGAAVVLGITDAAGDEHLVPLLDDTLRKTFAACAEAPLTLRLAVPEGLWAP